MKVHVSINAAQAIKAGRAECGDFTLDLTEAEMASLNDDHRALLADMHGVGRSATEHSDRLTVITPDFEGVVQELNRRLAVKAEKQAVREKEAFEWCEKAEKSLADGGPAPFIRQYMDTELPTLLLSRVKDLREQVEKREREERRLKDEADQARYAKQAAADKERKEKYDTERKEWIENHGSPRLRMLLAEDIGLNETYRDERLALERPGWVWYNRICGDADTIRDASQEALDALVAARKQYPDVRLEWLKCCDGNNEFCSFFGPHKSRPVLTDRFLGKTVVREVDE